MTERPEDPQVDETTEEDAVEPTVPDATDPVVASGSESAPGSGEVADAPATGEPPAPEESPATAPEESAPPVQAAPAGSAPEASEPADAAPPAKPAAAPKRRDAGGAGTAPVEVRATARYVRTSARKARLVCDHIRGKSVTEARAILAFTPRAAAKPWSKLLESAVANAEHNHELVGEDLRIAAVLADEGPTLKRFQPRAMGRATKIRKRTSHLTIILSPLDVPAGTRRGARRKGGR